MAVTVFMVSRFDLADGMQGRHSCYAIVWKQKQGRGTKKVFCWKMNSDRRIALQYVANTSCVSSYFIVPVSMPQGPC